jgi:hypothetical protein
MQRNVRAYFAGSVMGVSATALAALLFVAVPTSAEDQGPGTPPTPVVPQAAANEGVATEGDVAQRLASLEERIATLEKEKEEARTVKAPFVVTDGAGKEIFRVAEDAGGAVVTLVGSGSSVAIEAGAQASLRAVTGDKSVGVGNFKEGSGLLVHQGGQSLAELSDRNNGRFAVRIAAQGSASPVFQAGYHASGQPAISLWDGDTQVARIEKETGAAGGRLTLASADKRVELGIMAKQAGLIILQGNVSSAELSDRNNNGKFALRIAEPGNERTLMQAGYHSSGRIGVSVWEGDNPIAFLERAEAGGGLLNLYNKEGKPSLTAGLDPQTTKPRLMLGDEAAARVQLGIGTDDGSFVSWFDQSGANRALLIASSNNTDLTLSDATAKPVFQVGDDEKSGKPALVLGNEGAVRFKAGQTSDGAGAYMSLIEQDGKDRASILVDPNSSTLQLTDKEAKPIFIVERNAASQKAQMVVGDPAGAHVQAGPHVTGDGAYLSLTDKSGKDRAGLTGTTARAQLNLIDNSARVDLGTNEKAEKQPGLFIGKGDADVALLRLDAAGGGTLRIAGPDGKPVVGLLATEKGGGSVVVTAPGGGIAVGGLEGNAQGGKLTLWETSGEPRVDLRATDKADVQLTAKTGMISFTTGEVGPGIRISDLNSVPILEAGMTTDGVGIVRTGPGGNGPAGTLGAGLQAASEIMGRKE